MVQWPRCFFVSHDRKFLLLLALESLDAYNHVDYSSTLGGVCKVHISAQATSS